MKAYDQPQQATAVEDRDAGWLDRKVLAVLSASLNGNCGEITLTLPSGFTTQLGIGEPKADVRLKSYMPLLRLYLGGINGWSESYLAGEWESSDLTSLVKWALSCEEALTRLSKASFVTGLLHNLYHSRRDNSRSGSKKNIAAHYDLGNSFYNHWLDESMTYSAALYSHPDEPLKHAQDNKYDRILELLEANAGEEVVEIGCGWGGFALRAGRDHQLNVHGITLSQEQLKWAQEKIAKANIDTDVRLTLTDYRDLNKQYDAVVSIEMFEAVGEQHWDTYFETLKRVLKPGGKAVLQIITIEDERFHSYRKQADFIQRYVFPGGMLPSNSVLRSKIEQHGFKLQRQQLFGKDYARTLRTWFRDFEHSWERIRQQGFDDTFYRLWRYYLAYCEGGFEHGALDVGLYVISHAEDGR